MLLLTENFHGVTSQFTLHFDLSVSLVLSCAPVNYKKLITNACVSRELSKLIISEIKSYIGNFYPVLPICPLTWSDVPFCCS